MSGSSLTSRMTKVRLVIEEMGCMYDAGGLCMRKSLREASCLTPAYMLFAIQDTMEIHIGFYLIMFTKAFFEIPSLGKSWNCHKH
jgi:hypothetical protein